MFVLPDAAGEVPPTAGVNKDEFTMDELTGPPLGDAVDQWFVVATTVKGDGELATFGARFVHTIVRR